MYRRGSVIRQPLPHPEHPHGARRWRVLGVEGDDYFVLALFSDGGPCTAYWNTALCEAVTELEWQDDEVGRLGADGLTYRKEKVRHGNASQAADPSPGP